MSNHKKNPIKKWLSQNDYAYVVELIIQVETKYREEGKKTRRNWWDILSGTKDGKERTVAGINFPVIQAIRRRQGLDRASNAISNAKRESAPRIVYEGRWARN